MDKQTIKINDVVDIMVDIDDPELPICLDFVGLELCPPISVWISYEVFKDLCGSLDKIDEALHRHSW